MYHREIYCGHNWLMRRWNLEIYFAWILFDFKSKPETEEMAIFTVFQLLFEALLTLNPFFIHFFPDIEKEYN